MAKYIMRLDDAAEKREIDNWNRMEDLLDLYDIKPLVGVIPKCRDPKMEKYNLDACFWNRVNEWKVKGWIIAMHGYEHVYVSKDSGIHPVNHQSEFAGISLDIQRQKIQNGVQIFKEHGLEPKVFFAPSHTFDSNTLKALEENSDIRIISDTIAYDIYFKDGFTFVPQQTGRVRKLPFRIVTFCYHPNTMREADFIKLEYFLKKYNKKFIIFPQDRTYRKNMIIDRILNGMYMFVHKLRGM